MEELNVITEADRYVFGKGCHYEIYRKLGAHIMEIDNKKQINLNVNKPLNNVRPSADALFCSASKIYKKGLLGIVDRKSVV